jgi:hypothetical protein
MLTQVVEALESLPDPLVYILIAVGATGAVYSTVHHVKNWRPRKIKRLKLKGAEGKKIEDCIAAPHRNTAENVALSSWSLGTLARSTNYNVAFAYVNDPTCIDLAPKRSLWKEPFRPLV